MRIVCLDLSPDSPGQRRMVAGIRRYAAARGWDVLPLPRTELGPATVPATLTRQGAVGCVVFDSRDDGFYPPSLFGDVPVVYLDSPGRVRWRGATSVRCDNAAVTRTAFRELAAGLPESYAFVPSESMRPWNAERLRAFRVLCAEAGRRCRVFPGRRGEDRERRRVRIFEWVARLPRRCAVFAANDNTAVVVADAFAAAGRSLPRDNSLVGVDGDDIASDGGDISGVSSVKIDYEQAGFLAAKALLSRATQAAFGPLLVVRRPSTGGRGRREPRILEAVGMIRREACDGLTAAALSARFPGSRNLFERRFREAMGHSVLDEILHVRLEHVLNLLGRPDMPIAAIAAFSGFSSERELRHLFRRRFHVSMRTWKREHNA